MHVRHPSLPLGLAAGLVVALSAMATVPAGAAVTYFTSPLDGVSESPPNASPGSGFVEVDFDPAAHTMRVYVSFADLIGTTTASHIHGPTAVAGAGTAGVATVTPTFTGFPLGVTSGTYDQTYDLTLASSYNPSFITANGGTAATAEAALYQALLDGKAYLNVHTTFAPGGEIRGFLAQFNPTPTAEQTWGRIKSLYR